MNNQEMIEITLHEAFNFRKKCIAECKELGLEFNTCEESNPDKGRSHPSKIRVTNEDSVIDMAFSYEWFEGKDIPSKIEVDVIVDGGVKKTSVINISNVSKADSVSNHDTLYVLHYAAA